jgi:uncharacterized protein YqjF (DUF2071 family)
MRQRWVRLTFLHWPFEPDTVQKLLPRGLELETCEGAAWVGLVPFVVEARPPLTPAALSLRFPETNVRTYVRGPRGKRGVWFFSLDAARLAAVAGARALYRLPYMWSDMSVSETCGVVRYRSRRKWPRPAASSDIVVAPGSAFAPIELRELDHFLTARWRVYCAVGSGLAAAKVEHPPWPLARARVLRLEQDLIPAAGLPAPRGEPLVHYSAGVDVRIGAPLPQW